MTINNKILPSKVDETFFNRRRIPFFFKDTITHPSLGLGLGCLFDEQVGLDLLVDLVDELTAAILEVFWVLAEKKVKHKLNKQ